MATIRAAGVRDKHELFDAMAICIGSPIDDLLMYTDPLVRALAMLDRRVGKRRLAEFEVPPGETLVAEFHLLRLEAQGIRRHDSSAPVVCYGGATFDTRIHAAIARATP